MAMTAALTVVGNCIVNSPTTCTITISNSGGSAVNVTSIQPKVFLGDTVINPIAGAVSFSPIFVPVGQAIANTAGFQNSIQVGAGGSATVSFQLVVLGPVKDVGMAQGGPAFYVSADINSDDGSVFSPIPQALAVAKPQFGEPRPIPNASATQFGGALQFNQGGNSALAL